MVDKHAKECISKDDIDQLKSGDIVSDLQTFEAKINGIKTDIDQLMLDVERDID